MSRFGVSEQQAMMELTEQNNPYSAYTLSYANACHWSIC